MYIDDGGNGAGPLTVYVPHDGDSLEVCFGSSLPRRLVEWMATDPLTNVPDSSRAGDDVVAVVTGILITRSAVAINCILDISGIVDVTVPGLGPEVERATDVGADHGGGHGASTPRGTPEEVSSPLALDAGPSPSTDVSDDTDALTGISTPGSAWTRPSSPSTTTTTPTRSRTLTPASPPPRGEAASPTSGPYRRLLAHVVRSARATATGGLPRLGTASTVPDEDDRDEAPEHIFPATTDEEKKLVGAAGELFAFELLRCAILRQTQGQGLSRGAWQTPIRALAAAGHDEYAGMAAWPREERADIIVDDDDSGAAAAAALVRLLVEGGYLPADADAAGSRQVRRCFVEVKATMGPCGAPFYMSDSQYRKVSLSSAQVPRV